jgi:hypothetical protein
MITAVVAMTIRSNGKLDQLRDKIAHLPNYIKYRTNRWISPF